MSTNPPNIDLSEHEILQLKNQNDGDIVDRYLDDEYSRKRSHRAIKEQFADNEVKTTYFPNSKPERLQQEWQAKKEKRKGTHEKIRDQSRKFDRRRFRGDEDVHTQDREKPGNWEPIGTIIVNNRGAIARKAIETAMRKGFRVVCFYTDADEGANYLDKESYREKIKDYARDLEYAPRKPEKLDQIWDKCFTAIKVKSHTIKLKDKSIWRNKDGSINVQDTIDNNENIRSMLDAFEKARDFCNDLGNGLGIYPGYGFDAENSDFVEFLEAYQNPKTDHESDKTTKERYIHWVGPNAAVMKIMGDKGEAFDLAIGAGVRIPPATEKRYTKEEKDAAIKAFMDFAAKSPGKKLRMKCTNGGGGRGQATIDTAKYQDSKLRNELSSAFDRIISEGGSFGGETRIFVENFVENAKHIEAQIVCDEHNNIKILGLRDCSIQFNNQKCAERTFPRNEDTKEIYDKVVENSEKLLRKLQEKETPYVGAGTLEFLVNDKGEVFFMEMNTRVQVEHGVTEEETDDHILGDVFDIANGHAMWKKERNIKDKEGEPNSFVTQTRINAYELGLTNDEITTAISKGILGDLILPKEVNGIKVQVGIEKGDRQTDMTDSMIFIITAEGFNEEDSIRKMVQALQKTRIVGLSTNLPVMREYYQQRYEHLQEVRRTKNTNSPVQLIREDIGYFERWYKEQVEKSVLTPSMYDEKTDLEKLVDRIFESSVNGAEGRSPLGSKERARDRSKYQNEDGVFDHKERVLKAFQRAKENMLRRRIECKDQGEVLNRTQYFAKIESGEITAITKEQLADIVRRFEIDEEKENVEKKERIGLKQLIDQYGADCVQWEIVPHLRQLFTDTTTRDGRQSNISTRNRSIDQLSILERVNEVNLFSVEDGGGATADVALRYLQENFIDNSRRTGNMLEFNPSQILWRGLNTVGYGPSHEFIVELFLQLYADAGVQIFRIFDSMNDFDSMASSIKAVRRMGLVAEATICYAGGLADNTQEEYKIDYYVNLAAKLVEAGAHTICIKDMAGLMTPLEAGLLFEALSKDPRLEGIPLHFHTHDTLKTGVSASVEACKHGAKIVDASIGEFASGLAQPSMQAIAYQLAADEEVRKNPRVSSIVKATVEKMHEMDLRISWIRKMVFSKMNTNFGGFSDEDKERYYKELELYCKELEGERAFLVKFLDSNEDAFSVNKNLKNLFKQLHGELGDIRETYNLWDSKVDIELHVILSYIPGGMVSNYDSQIKERHLEDLRKEIVMAYVLLRKWFGNPPLVTPSSKYVGDQAIACVESLIATIGVNEFKEMMAKGLDNITVDEFFGGGDFIIKSTREMFTGSLGKHPNPEGIDDDWKIMIEENMDKHGVKRYNRPVAYYQSVERGEEYAKALKKLFAQGGAERDAVNIFFNHLREHTGIKITSFEEFADRINRVSDERSDYLQSIEEQLSTEEWEGGIETFCTKLIKQLEKENHSYVQKKKDILENLMDKFSLTESEVENGLKSKKWDEESENAQKAAEYVRENELDKTWKELSNTIDENNESIKVLDKDLNDARSAKQKKISADSIRAAINYVQDKRLEELQEQTGKEVKDLLGDVIDFTEGLERATEHFIFSSALKPGYEQNVKDHNRFGNLVEQLPTEVFANGLNPGEEVLIRDGSDKYIIKLLGVDKPKDLFGKKSYTRRVKAEIRLVQEQEDGTTKISRQEIYGDIEDLKLKRTYAKKFRDAQKSVYGSNDQFDIKIPSGGMIKAPLEKDGKPIGSGTILEVGDTILEISSNKNTVEIVIEPPRDSNGKEIEGVTKVRVISIVAEEWDDVATGKCAAIVEPIYEDREETEFMAFPFMDPTEKAQSQYDRLSPLNTDTVGIRLNCTERLQSFKAGDIIGYWIDVNGEETPIEAKFDCLVDVIHGDRSTDPQDIEFGRVAVLLKKDEKVEEDKEKKAA